MRHWLTVMATALVLGACGSILPVPQAPSTFYNLSPKSTFSQQLPEVSWQLVIEEPLAAGGLNSSSIAFRPTPLELKYFKDVRWTERVPRMVQTLLVESFENSGTIVAVGRQAIGLRADYSLLTEIREFQAERMNGGVVRVRLNAKLIKQPRQIIVSSRSFETAVPDTGESMDATVRAWDRAIGDVMKDVVQWTIVEGETDWRRRQEQRRRN
ncbi:MAG: ABC-type transport auxiliary lipoprotein family protein [Minwuia sp.]|uniref:ABC-type transport auxiliary lipoprotein family protein n=1 Tax=Minwuia sp. TaxID=2493630 RepID=UPI003A856414